MPTNAPIIEHNRDLSAIVRNVYSPDRNQSGALRAIARILLPTIQFVAPALGDTRPLSGSLQTTAAAGAALTSFTAVPDGVVRLLIAAEVSHNDPVARDSNISIVRGTTECSIVSNGALATGIKLPMGRGSFVLCAGDILRFRVNAIAGVNALTAAAVWYDFPDGSLFPNFA